MAHEHGGSARVGDTHHSDISGDETIVQLHASTGYGTRYRFPEIKNLNSLQIRLQREACFGTCPSYMITVYGDGTVRYVGGRCVAVHGVKTEHISQDTVLALINEFRDADFFSLLNQYNAGIVDAPSAELSLKYDGYAKIVRDGNASGEGMPDKAAALFSKVDKLANVERLIGAGGEPCP